MEPITRIETYLAQIADNTASGGGGGGSSLPAVTSADEGKGLSVQNGAWGKDLFAGYDVVVRMDTTPTDYLLADDDLHLLKGSWAECVRLMDAALPIKACAFYHSESDGFTEVETYTVSTYGYQGYGDVVDLYLTGGRIGYDNFKTIYLSESGLSVTAP